MRLALSLITILLSVLISHGAIPHKRVPSEMEFAGLKLKLTEAARREIQHEVDLLTQSEKYYNIKADRIKLYFPIIDEVLENEGVPVDFKYLAVQESALISDAVSSAQAVGFWQFKDFTGREMGLRIDRRTDERLNIVSSTHGAAKYFKRHNFYFNNWIYTLLAHMTGMSGAKKYVDESKFGAKKMVIDKKTHWYIRRCLAHKVAFEGADKGKHSEGLYLTQYKKGGGQTLAEIAKKSKIEEGELFKYNKWLKTGVIPEDKTYVVLIPTEGSRPNLKKIESPKKEPVKKKETVHGEPASIAGDIKSAGTIFIKINGLNSMLASQGDNFQELSKKSGITAERLARFNDLDINDQVREGEIYYLQAKRRRAKTYFYTVKRGENWWDVSQRFGIRLNSLQRLNRMQEGEVLEPGRVLWLRKRMSKYDPIEVKELPEEQSEEALPSEPITSKSEHQVNQPVAAEEKVATPQSVEVNEETAEPAEEEPKQNEIKENMEVSEDIEEHLVKTGETLYSLSKQYGISVKELLDLNNLDDPALKIGQLLRVKSDPIQEELLDDGSEENSSDKPFFHEVQPGDTLYGISKKYDVPVTELLKINQKENFDLSIGEKIRIR